MYEYMKDGSWVEYKKRGPPALHFFKKFSSKKCFFHWFTDILKPQNILKPQAIHNAEIQGMQMMCTTNKRNIYI